MRISDLIRLTGAPKQTIHYYIREGVLPRPKKTAKNSAEYGEEHVERILLIKELQEKYFLPLSFIKKILKQYRSSKMGQSLLRVHSEYFRPLEHMLPVTVKGADEFLLETGMSREGLEKFEEWGIIKPEVENGIKIYSHDDLNIGKVIGDMSRVGFEGGVSDGCLMLKRYRDQLRDLLAGASGAFSRHDCGAAADEDVQTRLAQGREIIAVYFYHLTRKILNEQIMGLNRPAECRESD